MGNTFTELVMLQIRHNTQNLDFLVLEVSWRNNGRILGKLKNTMLHFLPHFWYLFDDFFSTWINRASWKCINIFWKIFKSDFWYPKNLILWLQYVPLNPFLEWKFNFKTEYHMSSVTSKTWLLCIYFYFWKGVVETESCTVPESTSLSQKHQCST